MEEHCLWLNPRALLSLLSYAVQDLLPRLNRLERWVGPPTLIINGESALQTNLLWAFSQLSFPHLRWLWFVSSWPKLTRTSCFKLQHLSYILCYINLKPIPKYRYDILKLSTYFPKMSPRTILLIRFATRVGCLFVINTVYINIIGCLSLNISQHFLGSDKGVSATFIQLWISQSVEDTGKLQTRHSAHTLYTHIWTHTALMVIHVRWTSWWQPTGSQWNRQSEKRVLCWDCLLISQLSRGPW